jgi:ubiquinone/menaquinone biosynthesis C-methylase UbiE
MQAKHADVQQKATDYFESSADYWRDIYSDNTLLPTIYQDRHKTVLDWITDLRLPMNARILEVGCGAALISFALAEKGYLVQAIDSAAAMLRMTHRTAINRGLDDRITLQRADVHDLPFQAQSFDLVVAIGVIPWLESESAALLEMHRVLRTGGHLLVTADNNARLNRILDPLSSPIVAPIRMVTKYLLRLCRKWPPVLGFQPKRHYPHKLHSLLRDCNFDRVRSRTVGFGPFSLFGKKLLDDPAGVRLHRRLQAVAPETGLSILRWTGSHHLVLATKA